MIALSSLLRCLWLSGRLYCEIFRSCTSSSRIQLSCRVVVESCEIINHNTGRAFTIEKQGNNLYPVRPAYFYKNEATPAPSAERPPALLRFEREEKQNMTPLQIIQQSRKTEEERLQDEQLAECLRYQMQPYSKKWTADTQTTSSYRRIWNTPGLWKKVSKIRGTQKTVHDQARY